VKLRRLRAGEHLFLVAGAALVALACTARTRADAAATAAPLAAVAASAPARAGPNASGASSGSSSAATVVPSSPAAGVHLEGADALRGLFARLAELEARTASEDVRVAQLGDSHTASDYGVSVVRRLLAERFGDGGRGFIPLGKPYKRLFQAGELTSDGDGFEPEEGRLSGGRRVGDGCYGPAGIAMESARAGARIWSRYGAPASTLELAYAESPGGGSFDVRVDDTRVARVETRREGRAAAFRVFDVADGAHHVEVRANGDGAVRVFGVTLGSAAKGVVVDALGINGAKVTTPLEWEPAHLAEQLRHRPPALVILAYGTNECGDRTTPAEHEQHFAELLRRVRAGAPKTSCLLLGPPDRAVRGASGAWSTMPKLLELVEAQRRAARASGCAFYDQLAAMGGPGAIDAWSKEARPRARGDHVHLTREGYAALATSMVREVLAAYVTDRTRTR